MKKGYIRVSKAGPSRSAQVEALLAAGVEDFDRTCYVDIEKGLRPHEMVLRQRALALRSLRAGDVLVIAAADRLGRGGGDLTEVLAAITAKGCAVLDAETGETIRAVEGLSAALAFIERAERQARRRAIEKMRDTRKRLGILGGRPTSLRGAARQQAALVWADASLSAKDAALKIGIPVRTAYRLLGSRGGEKPPGKGGK